MNTYRSVSITIIAVLAALLIVTLIFEPDNMNVPILAFLGLFFIIDTIYHLNERKEVRESRKFIFPYVDFSWRKKALFIILIICLIGVVYIFYSAGDITTSLFIFGFFGLFLLRAIIFDKQTLQSIKVSSKYIEYGLGIFDVERIDTLKSYTIDYEKRILILHKEKNDIRIKLKYLEEIKKLDEVLKERIKETR
jgi:hypothetical protein